MLSHIEAMFMQKTPGESSEEREEYWVKVIEAARQHPGGVTAYCAKNGINKNNYYKWFQKLRFSHPEWEDLANNPVHRAKRIKAKREKQKRLVGADVEVESKPSRRSFTAAYKERILRETDSVKAGEVAEILRREGLYWSTLRKWRVQKNAAALTPLKRGKKADPQAERIKQLEKENERLLKKLKQKDMLLDLQKKIAQILETTTESHES